MTTTIASVQGTRGRFSLVVVALAAPVLILAGLATNHGPLLLALLAAAGLAVASLRDVRAAFLILVLLCTFVDYTTGILTLEMAIVCGWVAWAALLLYWRSAWTGWVRPPGEMLPGIAVWLAACAMGVVVGLVRGNPLKNLGIELEGALWPLMGFGMMQAFGRRHAVYAGVGLFAIGLVHTGFGLTMLQIEQHRLGGIYFTTVTGIVAVMLWSAAILAPRRRTRWLCLLGMIPMLAHLLFSFTRGYWFGAIAGLATATVLGWRTLGRFHPQVRVRRLLLVPAFAGVAGVTILFSIVYFGNVRLLDAVGGRFSSSFSTEVGGATMSNVIRLAEYDKAIGAALKSPVIGRGLGYVFVVREPITNMLREQWFVHNYYLLTWLTLGLVGVAAFGYLIWRQVRAALRVAREDASWTVRAVAITAVAVTVQVLVILLTNYSLADVTTASVFGYVWGLFWSIRADESRAGGRAASSSS